MATRNQIPRRFLLAGGAVLYLGAVALGCMLCFQISTTDYQERVVSGTYVKYIPIRTRPPETDEALTRVQVVLTIAILACCIGYLAYERYKAGHAPGLIPSALSAAELKMLRATNALWQNEAVRVGVAEWLPGDHGGAVFAWKTCPTDQKSKHEVQHLSEGTRVVADCEESAGNQDS
jgi:hypothetical protein